MDYRDSARPKRMIVQIVASESGNNADGWSVTLHALDDRGAVWRYIVTVEKGKLRTGVWILLPALPEDKE